MMFRSQTRWWCSALALAGALLGRTPAVEPPPLAEHQIKALYLFNFTKYVEWPAATNNATPFVIGVCEAREVKDDLVEITRDKRVQGRPIVVQTIKAAQDVATCQLLFIGATDQARLVDLLKLARNSAVLTVGETEDFLAQGGIINFVRQENNMRVAISLDAAQHARLVVSAKLLAVAKLVKGRPEAPRK